MFHAWVEVDFHRLELDLKHVQEEAHLVAIATQDVVVQSNHADLANSRSTPNCRPDLSSHLRYAIDRASECVGISRRGISGSFLGNWWISTERSWAKTPWKKC